VKATVSVNVPSASMASVAPRISGRSSCSMSVSPIRDLSRAGSSTLPRITWTKPASSEPPSSISVTSSQSWYSTGPSSSAVIRFAHSPCSGRSEFRIAASRDSNRMIPTNWSSSVNP
jgi:hypothetical protein